MSSPNIKAFLALEKSAQNVLRGAFESEGQRLVQLIAQDPTSHAHVTQSLATFDHSTAMDAIKPKLKQLAVSAVLFGASRLKPTARTSFMKTLPHFVLDNAVGQMTTIAGTKAKQKISMDLSKLIANGAPARSVLKKSAMFACCPEKMERVCKAADDDAYPDLSDAMNAVVMGTGRVLSDVAGNLVMSRLTSYGFLSEAAQDGVKTYQVTEILDDKICPICMYMHGKTFDVPTALTRMATSLSTSDPDELKQSSPWPRQDKDSIADFLSNDAADLQGQGYDAPPFHPGCRGILVPDGEVDDTLPPLAKEPGNEIMQTIAEMKKPQDRPKQFKAPNSYFDWLFDLFDHGPKADPTTFNDDPEEDLE